MADLDRDVERCGFLCVHEDTVDQVLGQMPHDEQLYDLAGIIQSLWRFYTNQNSVCLV